MFKSLVIAMALLCVGSVMAQTASTSGAKVYIISPADGDVVESPVTIKFGLKGMGVAPAGTDRAGTGHHHLLIDKTELPVAGQPMGGEVIHFGGGQTETTMQLAPGQHRLQLVLGDKSHQPHQPIVMSKAIAITVK